MTKQRPGSFRERERKVLETGFVAWPIFGKSEWAGVSIRQQSRKDREEQENKGDKEFQQLMLENQIPLKHQFIANNDQQKHH